MMPVVLNEAALKTLKLDLAEIQKLSEEEQAKKIKRAWRKMCLKSHPDKGGNDEWLDTVNKAYMALTNPHAIDEPISYEINNYFTKQDIDIPSTAFDMQMQEGILDVFEALKKKFSGLPSEDAKRQFATYYASFLSLAQALEERRVEFTQASAAALIYQEKDEELFEFLRREWRMLIIRLFAEEYLDDFQYRNALAFGELLPILAIRKLLSPIKWVAVIAGSLDLLLRGTAEYCQRHRINYVTTGLNFIGAPVSILNFGVNLIASPVNNVIRPLAAYTGLPPIFFTSCLLGMGISLYQQASIIFSLTSASLLLPYLTLALNLYSMYLVFQVIRDLRTMGVPSEQVLKIGLLFGLVILINFIPTEPLADLFWAVVDVCTFNTFKKMFEEKPIEFLPLPESSISNTVKNATLLGYTKANQSHRFFGTPKNAAFQNERTFWQKTTSFFGVDEIEPKESAPSFDATSFEPIACT